MILNGVNQNDVPLYQMITIVQGSWYVLYARQPHSNCARSMHVLLWLEWVSCWVLERNYLRLAFSSVPFLSWNFEINLESLVKLLETHKLSNMCGGMGSCNMKWESPDNWKLNSGLITRRQLWPALALGLLKNWN